MPCVSNFCGDANAYTGSAYSLLAVHGTADSKSLRSCRFCDLSLMLARGNLRQPRPRRQDRAVPLPMFSRGEIVPCSTR